MKKSIIGILVLLMVLSCQSEEKTTPLTVENGVSETLAIYRKEALSEIEYQLHFEIPEDSKMDIPAKAVIQFEFNPERNKGLQLDFKEEANRLKSLKINDDSVEINWEREHLVIAPKHLVTGKNKIEIDFIAGNSALNRRDNFLYTLFVPDRARGVFPVFDQPDLKAKFELSLQIPKHWKAIANGKLKDIREGDENQILYFETTEVLPTYLFSFVAGEFEVAKEKFDDQEIELFYRETDSEKIEHSLPEIFKRYKEYVRFYEQWTGISYPFQKHGMVAIPDFQFGGMEHPGAILLQSSTLFLPEKATENQLNNRAHLLAHEVAHMWFGDLVTMKWFNDVWTKEVFANFMADKATGDAINQEDFNLKFLVDHFPTAYAVDRTLGANPIRQKLDNLKDAGTMYGNIIYHKSPIMMRQLENLMGEEAFQKGIKKYLKDFSYNNATWPELIEILNDYTEVDLLKWNKVWVNEPGRPILDYDLKLENEKITDFTLTQTSEDNEDKFWSQSFEVSLYSQEGEPIRYRFSQEKDTQQLSELLNKEQPEFVLFNATGEGYGVMPIDTKILTQLFEIEDKVARASVYISLYENMLNKRYLNPDELLTLFSEGMKYEKEELNLNLLSRYLTQIYWSFISPQTRLERNPKVEESLWSALEKHHNPNAQKIVFNTYVSLFESETAGTRLYQIWENQNPPLAIHLTEEDYTDLAFALQLRKDWNGLLDRQYERIENADRKKRFELIRPALSFDINQRDAFFESLLKAENRRNESAVLSALQYLHHPLRGKDSEKYLKQTLEILPEIQKTGDIFFPGRWLGASFGKYRSASAYQIVEEYLKTHPDLNPKLREKLLQETDNLRRAQEL